MSVIPVRWGRRVEAAEGLVEEGVGDAVDGAGEERAEEGAGRLGSRGRAIRKPCRPRF
jgi:hypothetical protein